MAHIILIEDNPQTSRMASKLLNKRGYSIETFATGEEGLLRILETTPSLILIDLGLPDVDGQTVIGIIRQQLALSAIPVIAFTSWPIDMAERMTAAYGCDGIITKPIDTRRFVNQIEEFITAGVLQHGQP